MDKDCFQNIRRGELLQGRLVQGGEAGRGSKTGKQGGVKEATLTRLAAPSSARVEDGCAKSVSYAINETG